jgi:murein DD-endopeptidase MepM/ murein hydrolase activator NlpD
LKDIFKKAKTIKFLPLLNFILDHRLFKPIAVSIIITFVLVNSLSFIQNFISSHHNSEDFDQRFTPITINISDSGSGFNMDEEQVIDYQVKSGDTLLKILLDLGAKESDVFNILEEMRKFYNPRLISNRDVISINYKVKVTYESEKTQNNDDPINREVVVNNLSMSISPEEQVVISRNSKGEYKAKKAEIKISKYISRYSGTLKNGLYLDGVRAGISPTAVMNMINLYSYDVDFQRDVKTGDKFEMIVESFYTEDGKKLRDGNILFASLVLRDKPIDLYLYTINNRSEYFDSKGNSARKSLLRTPINGARVSSSFGMRRHPVLGYSRMHKGIDFAARSGTPILAAGSGTIVYYGRYGGYGNFVKIKHNNKYSTAYGHASRFVKKLRVGSRVKQGDVVAYVGTTGRSTGPHLHFEVLQNGKAINPSKVKATSGLMLTGKELKNFKESKEQIDKYRKNIPNQIKVAQ